MFDFLFLLGGELGGVQAIEGLVHLVEHAVGGGGDRVAEVLQGFYEFLDAHIMQLFRLPLPLDLDELQLENQGAVGRDVVHLQGAVAPFGGDVHFPFVAFVHPRQGNLPAHDEVPHHEQRRQRLPLGGVEDGTVDETAGVMDIDDAARGGFLGTVALFQHLVQDAIV